MGFTFSLVGMLLIITGAQNTYADFGNTLKNDLTGEHNFTYWIAAILLIGVLGYVPALTKFSHWFLMLVLLSLFLSHKGFFAKFQAALASGPTAPMVSGSQAGLAGSQGSLGTAPTLEQHQSGLLGQSPETAGQSKFNGWMNYLLGGRP